MFDSYDRRVNNQTINNAIGLALLVVLGLAFLSLFR
jgi:hypothetical protein